MREQFRLNEIIAACDAEVLFAGPPEAADRPLAAVSTDSRTIRKGDLFIALSGERTDGHLYIDQAVKNGAAAVLAEKREAAEAYAAELPCLITGDSSLALARIARLWREKVNPVLIAVTGSVGKTSVRDMSAEALGVSSSVHKNEANQNNIYGVPYTLLAMPEDTEIAVIEAAMDRRGELSRISEATAPDIVMINTIGTSHIERLGSRRAIKEAKAELLEKLRPGGPLVLNGEDPFLLDLAEEKLSEMPLIFLSSKGRCTSLQTPLTTEDRKISKGASPERLKELARKASAYKGPMRFPALPCGTILEIEELESAESGMRVKLSAVLPDGQRAYAAEARFDKPALQHAANVLFAYAALLLCEKPLQEGLDALRTMRFTGSRQEMTPLKGGGLLIDDCYNASPESMKAAFSLVSRLAAGEKKYKSITAVLGGVKELGRFAGPLHREIGRAAAGAPFDCFYLIGEYAGEMAAGIRERRSGARICCLDTQEELLHALESAAQPGTLYLVKASRGYQLEKSCALIQKKLGTETKGDGRCCRRNY